MLTSFSGTAFEKTCLTVQEPQLLEKPWVGEWNATRPGSPCLQYNHFEKTVNDGGSVEYAVVGDEDCLFVNVYTQDTGNAKCYIYVPVNWLHTCF